MNPYLEINKDKDGFCLYIKLKVRIKCCREKLGTFIFKFSDTVFRPTLMLIYNHPTLYFLGKCCAF